MQRAKALLFSLLTSAVLAAACSAAPSAPRPPALGVSIGATSFPASTPVYVAAERGFFAAEGLDATVRTFASGGLALDAALAGDVDFATVAETPIVRSVLDGKDPAVVAKICEIDGANVVIGRRDRGIAKAEDLRGKRVAVVPSTTGDFFLHIYLTTSGIDPADVEILPVSPDEIVPAVLEGRADAASTWAPFTIQLRDGLGPDAVVLDQPGLYTMSWNVAVRPGFADQDEEAVRRFLRAIMRANEYIASNPTEAQAIASKRTGIRLAAIREHWDAYHWMVRLDQALILSLEDEARVMAGAGKQPPDFLSYLHTGALRAVRPEDVDVVEPRD